MSLGFSRILLCSTALGVLLYSPAASSQSHIDSTQQLIKTWWQNNPDREPGGWYISLSGSENSPTIISTTFNFDRGYAFSGAIGRYYGGGPLGPDFLRVEFEVSHSNSKKPLNNADRALKYINIMGNVYYDFMDSKSRFSPYVGAGLGASQIKHTDNSSKTQMSSMGGRIPKPLVIDDWFFSTAAMAGVRIYIKDNIHVSAEYKFLYSVGDFYFCGKVIDLYSHNIGMKLGFDF